MKTVLELIEDLQKLNEGAIIHIYGSDGDTLPPDKIIVADNDDDEATEYHLYSTYDEKSSHDK